MKGIQLNFSGDPNIGLFAKSCDKYCLIGKFVSDSIFQKVESVLNVRVIRSTVASTDLAGMFVLMNGNGIVLPKIISNIEKTNFDLLKKELDINVEILSTRFTAIGNLVVCNDKGAVVSRFLTSKDKTKIKDCLDVEVDTGRIAKMDILGSTALSTNKGCIVHRDANEKEVQKLQDVLKVNVDIGTANFGSPFVGSCVVANSNGFIAGGSTTGPEVSRIMETLDLIK